MFTLIRFAPSSHAMLRAIWSTADFDELYDTQAWSCDTKHTQKNNTVSEICRHTPHGMTPERGNH